MNKYIHYGSKEFLTSRFNPIKNRLNFAKPSGGLWASPINSPFGWRDWCECESFREYEDDDCFVFSLKDSAKILKIKSKEDFQNLPSINPMLLEHGAIGIPFNFEEISKEYDTIEIIFSENPSLHYYFYGWDCDTLLVMNPKIIVLD